MSAGAGEEIELVLESPERLDRVVARAFRRSRAAAVAQIERGQVEVNGIVLRKASVPVSGLVVVRCAPEELPQFPALPHLWDDPSFVVVEKPVGLLTHRVGQRIEPTVVDAVRAEGVHLAGGPAHRAGVVHRLDRATSGVLLLACSEAAHASLQAQFAARTVEKHYRAVVLGTPDAPAGTIDAPIGVPPKRRATRVVAALPDARPAVTHFRVLESSKHLSLLDLHPITGRTHQLRAHLASIGHPVLGDAVYTHPRAPRVRIAAPRLFLHSTSLAFDHPDDGSRVTVESPVPPIFLETLHEDI